jgi:lipopolysaccharide transport system ATP-binding protein
VLAVGDAAFQKKCLGKMGDVAKEGRTVLFVSHNMGAVAQLCSKSLLLEKGHLSDIGPSDEIIKEYLAKHCVNRPEITLPYEKHKKGQYIGFRILNGEGIVSSEINCDDSLTIELLFEIRERMSGLVFACYLQNVEGSTVFYTNSTDCTNFQDSEFDSGLYKFSIRLPSRLLAPKMYYVNAGCISISEGYQLIDQKDQICSFEIRDFTSWRGDGRPGFFGLKIPWTREICK